MQADVSDDRNQTVHIVRDRNVDVKLVNVGNRKMSVIIEYYDEGTAFYTRMYKKVQGKIWDKYERFGDKPWKKWYFKCFACGKVLCKFASLRCHLHVHYGFRPEDCRLCPEKYRSRYSLERHLKLQHDGIDRKTMLQMAEALKSKQKPKTFAINHE